MNTTSGVPAYDASWTLFLDRDGVVNVEAVGHYITNWSEFQFCEGALPALKALSEIFGRIVIVTNQRGVGRGLMSLEDLRDINAKTKAAVLEAGGRIDRIYAATAISDDDHNRKPNVGMAMQARQDFPEIDLRKSVIVGNALSDMEFGKRVAMHTVFLTTKHGPFELPHDLIDEQFPSLQAWSHSLEHQLVG
jgi:histidinol-phosphate phosphatase family protein